MPDENNIADMVRPTEVKHFVTYTMARVQAKLNAQGAAILKRHSKLSLVQWRVIALLASGNCDSLTTLCRLSGMDKGQVSRKLTQLVSDGLVRSRLDEEDHRSQKLSLTDEGLVLYDRILPIMRSRQAHITGEISQDELAILLEMLGRIETAADRRDF
ncbi:winged helix-turn-helix transcriptional regulator [Actibacterium sp. 188UL27-1]|nr:winged helix-turn-helix transcriptional regulator [Actibacterium sp. 188UL27-1]